MPGLPMSEFSKHPISASPAPDQGPLVAPQAVALSRQARRLATLPSAPWLHEEVARRLAAKLDDILLTPEQFIDWGAFLGAGGHLVQQRYPQARRWVAEPTLELLGRSEAQWQAQARKAWWAPWRREASPLFLTQTDATPPWPAEGVALLWANMALHAHADVPDLLAQWHRALAVNGFLMCSGLGPDTARELRDMYQSLGWSLPTVHFVDMHDLGDALVEAGFADPVMDMERLTLTWQSGEAMLAELRTWGGNVARGRFAGLRTPRWRAALVEALETHLKQPDGRLGMTIELVYGHAVKPVPRAPLSAETKVSLQDMRSIIKQGSARS